jgi:1,4-dihydroxy-6-naphthoate synthase
MNRPAPATPPVPAEALSLGYSPCPNDTFIFYALTHGQIDTPTVRWAPPRLEDVETLNGWALEGRLAVTKLSFHALALVLDDYCLLSSGSALGRGCGPLLVARGPLDLDKGDSLRVAIPGRLTTAALLFRLFLPACTNLVEMRFDTIMEAVRQGQVDAGVIIHESRFTYQEKGLVCLQDLGQWWEASSGHPVPLGCIAAKRALAQETIAAIDHAIGASIDWAFAHPQQCQGYIREHAQEMERQVMQSHIELFVNDFSRRLGKEGLAAVTAFVQRGRAAGILPFSSCPLQCDSLRS